MDAHVAIWIVTVITWAILLFNLVRLRLIPRYRLISVFILTSMCFEGSLPWLASELGAASTSYALIFLLHVTVTAALAATILIRIYAIFGNLSIRVDWHLIVVPAALILLLFSDGKPSSIFARLMNAAFLSVTYLGVAAIMRSRRHSNIQIGWNLKMVLLALTVPYVFQSIVLMVYEIGLPLSHQATSLWLHSTSLASWIILAVGMIEYSPPTLVAAEGSESDMTNGESGRKQPVGNLSETRDQLC